MYKRDENTGKRMSYTYTADWFSFGCCLAEFISGCNPFRSEKAYRFGIDCGEKAKVGQRSLQKVATTRVRQLY